MYRIRRYLPAGCCFCFAVKRTKESRAIEMSIRCVENQIRDNVLDGRIGSLPEDALQSLCCQLSIRSHLHRDWRKIAGYIRLPSVYVSLIDSRKDGKLEARMLFDLWDEGIEKNQGSVRKLLVALSECDFRGHVQDLLRRLQGCIDYTEEELSDYITRLSTERGRVQDALCPNLTEDDVVWEVTGVDRPSFHSPLETCKVGTIKDSVFVSWFRTARSRKYRQESKNLVKLFKRYGHTVFFDDGSLRQQNMGTWKERCMKIAETIIVIFNTDYYEAYTSHLDGRRVESCVAIDVPVLQQIFATGGAGKIIPVLVERCRHQPPDLPVWLSGTSTFAYPSKAKELVRCVQRVPEYQLQCTSRPIRVHTTTITEKYADEMIRLHKEKTLASQ